MYKLIGNYIIERGLNEDNKIQILKGKDTKTQKLVLIKCISKEIIDFLPDNVKILENEVALMKKLNSPHVVKLLDVITSAHNYYLIYEYCEEGSLEEIIDFRGKIPEKEAFFILRDLVTAVMDVNQNGVIHGSLRPDKFLKERTKGFKLCDLGLNWKIRRNLIFKSLTPMKQPPESDMVYFPPESKAATGAIKAETIQGDIWALGVIFYRVITGTSPVFDKNGAPMFYSIKNVCTPQSLALLEGMLYVDPNKRLTLKMIMDFLNPVCEKILEESREATAKKQNLLASNMKNMDLLVSRIRSDTSNEKQSVRPVKQIDISKELNKELNEGGSLTPKGQLAHAKQFLAPVIQKEIEKDVGVKESSRAEQEIERHLRIFAIFDRTAKTSVNLIPNVYSFIPCFLFFKKYVIFMNRTFEAIRDKNNVFFFEESTWQSFLASSEDYQKVLGKLHREVTAINAKFNKVLMRTLENCSEVEDELIQNLEPAFNDDLKYSYDHIFYFFSLHYVKNFLAFKIETEPEELNKILILRHMIDVLECLLINKLEYTADESKYFDLEKYKKIIASTKIDELNEYISYKKDLVAMFYADFPAS